MIILYSAGASEVSSTNSSADTAATVRVFCASATGLSTDTALSLSIKALLSSVVAVLPLSVLPHPESKAIVTMQVQNHKRCFN